MKILIVIAVSTFVVQNAWAFRPFILHSGKAKVNLIEYYTPVNCATCADSDKWISKLHGEKGIWKSFIPVWFTQDFPASLEILKVATPPEGALMMINGQETPFKDDLEIPVKKGKDVGDLNVARVKYQEFEITFTSKEKAQRLVATAALLGSGEKDFTVLELETKELRSSGNTYSAHIKMKLEKKPEIKNYSAVFWVTEEGGSAPIQVVGSDLKID